MQKIFVVLLLFLGVQRQAFAWGEEGHSVVAEIAQRRLTKEAAEQIAKILNPAETGQSYNVPSLASLSTWADEVRYADGQHPESYNWHFVDFKATEDKYDRAKMCPRPDQDEKKGDCAIEELHRLRNELRCQNGKSQLEALKFAVHFVGDIHQPFHTVYEQNGANGVQVTVAFKGKTCAAGPPCEDVRTNLHTVWDTTILRRAEYNWPAIVDALENGWLKSEEAKNDTGIEPAAWAEVTHREAVASTFLLVANNSTLDEAYYEKSRAYAYRQLGLAGLRLARYLNDVFSSKTCPVQ